MEEGHRLSVLRHSLAAGLATAGLRRLQAAWGVSALGSWTFFVTVAVYAYGEGGATAVGAAALVRMVPAGLAAPVAGMLADRFPRRDVLLGGLLIVAGSVQVAFAATAVLYAVAALAMLRIPRDPVPDYRSAAAHPPSLIAAVAGFREVAADPDLRLIVGFLSAATLVEGA